MAQRPPYVFATMIAAALGVAALSGCGLTEQTARDAANVPGTITSVHLDNAAGSVTLRGATGAKTVTVHRKIDYSGQKPAGHSYEAAGGVLKLHGCGDRCSVDYTVDLPAGLPVSGRNTAGSIHLTDVGRVDVTTSDGDIELDRVSGPVDARTSSGRVSGSELTGGRITARTSNGSIDLAAIKPADVTANSSNGGISLVVPKGGYDVSAETHNGRKNIGVADDPGAQHRLDLSTSNGPIDVKAG